MKSRTTMPVSRNGTSPRVFLLLAGTCLMFMSCALSGFTAPDTTLSITIETVDATLPVRYTVVGAGPWSSSFTRSISSRNLDITGLAAGTWAIKVSVFDDSGTLIAKGRESTILVAGSVIDLSVTVISSADPTGTTPGPVSLKGWELTEENTGLAGVGVDPSSLTVYTGSSTPEAGTVIRDSLITTTLDLSAGDITITRCLIRPTNVVAGSHILVNTTTDSTVTISDCDIDCDDVPASVVAKSCAFAGAGTIERCNIYGMGSGIWLRGSGSVASRLEGSYIHGLRAYGDPTTTGSHNDGMTVRDYSGPGMVISNNRIDCSSGNDTGALFIQPSAGAIDNVSIEGNLLEGRGYNLALEAALDRWPGNGYGANMIAINNRYSPTGWGAGYVSGGSGWADASENYINDPAREDNKGAAVSLASP
jgi:hypothetical protein